MNSLISILIVEDDAVIRAVLEMALAAEGFTKVSSCSRGDEGMDAARRKKPDLVLLDVMLPGLDGFSICRKISFHVPPFSRPISRNDPIAIIISLTFSVEKAGWEKNASAYRLIRMLCSSNLRDI